MTRLLLVLAVITVPHALGAQAPARQLELSFNKGLVTLRAANVTVPEILAEWSRTGGTLIVNGEKLVGKPLVVPVVFENQPEVVVLNSLLRSAAMWIVQLRSDDLNPALRQVGPNQSVYARIQILPTSNPSSSTPYVMTPAVSVQSPPPGFGAPEDEIPPVQPVTNPGQPPVRPGPQVMPVVTSPVPGQVVPIQAVPPGTPTAPPGTTTGRGRGGGGR